MRLILIEKYFGVKLSILLHLFIVNFGLAQSDIGTKKVFIRHYQNDNFYEVDYSNNSWKLIRANYTKPNLKEIIQFRKLNKKKLPMDLLSSNASDIPQTLTAFNHLFMLVDEQADQMLYKSAEKHSQVYFLRLDLDNQKNGKGKPIAIVQSVTNTRSGEDEVLFTIQSSRYVD